MRTKLLCAFFSILLIACGKSEPPSSPPAGDARPTSGINVSKVLAQAQVPQSSGPGDLKIKGLFLGMDIHEVPDAMVSMLAEQQLSGFGFTDPIKTGGGTQCLLLYTKPFLAAIEARMRDRYSEGVARGKVNGELLTSCINSDGVLVVKTNAGKEVSSIEFNDVKEIFNAKGVAPAEFARNLSRDFHLPELKPNAAQTVWTYISPQGDKLEVSSSEVLGIPMVKLSLSKTAL
ncbi:MAG: hypothetical protein HY306_07880 [Nitrosomonadales bacterium]|nr:hypothetical protein [Nitrosomonadales bacterium]